MKITLNKRNRNRKFFRSCALIVFVSGLFFAQNVLAATYDVGLSCQGADDAAVCSTFQDGTIDASKISKVELNSATWDDSGEITITSPTGKIGMVPSSGGGCLQSHGYEDITSLFPEKGIYKLHIEARNDCKDQISASASLTITVEEKPCTRPTSPKCLTPGICQTGPGECVVVNNAETCKYPVSKGSCESDNKACTYDYCKASADGLSATCNIGPNVCGGMIPCGRLVDDPTTPNNNESQECGLCQLALIVNSVVNFMFNIASSLALLALIITGIFFVISDGKPEKRTAAKEYFFNVIKGYAIIFLAWLIVDFILSAWGYTNPIKGQWNVICSLLFNLSGFI